MSFVSTKKFFGPDQHRARIAAALRRRLHPNTILHAKQLAAAIGVTPETIGNWRRGYCDPGSYEIGKLFQFFMAVEGGPGFWVDVFGPIGAQMMRRMGREE